MTDTDNNHVKTNKSLILSPQPGTSRTDDAIWEAEQDAAYLLCDAQASGTRVVGAVPLQLHGLVQDQAQVTYKASTLFITSHVMRH